MPEPKLRYHLKQFPIDSLAQWLPKDFAWQGRLNADLQLDLPASGPNGVISIDASGGTLRMSEKDQWLDFPYQTLKLTSKLTPKRIDTDLNFVGGKLGELSGAGADQPAAEEQADDRHVPFEWPGPVGGAAICADGRETVRSPEWQRHDFRWRCWRRWSMAICCSATVRFPAPSCRWRFKHCNCRR